MLTEYLGRGVTDYSAAQPGEPDAHRLQEALRIRFTVNQAVGVLMATHGITADQARTSFQQRLTENPDHPRTGRPRHHHRRHRHPEPGQTRTELKPEAAGAATPIGRSGTGQQEFPARVPCSRWGCVGSHPELAKTMSPDAHGDALAVSADQLGQSAVSLADGLDQPVTQQRLIEFAVRGIPGSKHASMRRDHTQPPGPRCGRCADCDWTNFGLVRDVER